MASRTPTAQIRHTGATVTLSGDANSRIMGVTTPGAVNQGSGFYEQVIDTGDELVLKPGEGIALYQEAAGDTDQKVFFKVQWKEAVLSLIHI